jgi:hypothetical protein
LLAGALKEYVLNFSHRLPERAFRGRGPVFRFLLLSALLLAAGPFFKAEMLWAQPLPPAPIMINRFSSLAQIGEKGRVVIDWDVTNIPGAKDCLIRVFNTKDPRGSLPVKQYTFHGPSGSIRITFDDLPIAVYRVFGTPLDKDDKPLPGGERPVFVEYGGPQAWETYEKAPHAVTANATKAPFQNLDYSLPVDGPSITLDPPSLILNRGQSGDVVAMFRGLAIDEPVDWKLDGSGHLKVLTNHRAVFTADKNAKIGMAATIHIQSRRLPSCSSTISVVVTAVASGQIHR